MAASVYEICKIALSRLGTETNFTAFGDDTPEARLLELYYDPSRKAVLRAHRWNFATRRAALVASSATPAFEYAYQFTLPTDFLTMVRTDLEQLGYDHDYRIEGSGTSRVLLTNDAAVSIEYIANITNTTLFDPLFDDVLAQKIAAEICPALTDNASMTQQLWDNYQMKLQEARAVDSQEGRPRDIVADKWLLSRL